ncbi:hypothetical protein [Actinomadura livida]|uniref:Uncharacterized protein n=1 Tax=Actinomadura livida TaxID=79909 RepID=A0A7W7MZF9_9ACTN|nr:MULTISPECIES: hypothetical protein [Actinomadura]MBB4775852.1 hypothetical protein [Actinomadura catellatispora]GGU35757.1 hypothetical protein GCM10010208_70440 [Actinomadura livida]
MRVTLLLLQYLFPEWSITLDREGMWRATGRVLISASDLDGFLDLLHTADPEACERAILQLREAG